MSDYRIETDSMGAVRVAKGALYQAQTQRALNNFAISGQTMPDEFIHALALIKKTAAETNLSLRLLNKHMARAIIAAAKEVMANKHAAQFPLDIFQTGSGTSSNMNMNEVLATLATKLADMPINPNDHVNLGQSSNDTVPSAIHISAALALQRQLLPALEHLRMRIDKKSRRVKSIVKTGRTHLMDAMPIRMSQEMDAWALQMKKSTARVKATLPRLYQLSQGGTAVGSGINAHPEFAKLFCEKLRATTKLPFTPNSNFFEGLATQDAAVELSGQLKTVAVSLMKISNDLRWMNSGPLAGLGEVELQALQPGSSIMPGKVNPVIPETVSMVAAQVIGNDTTITVAGQSGNFQLNVMLPVIAHNLLQSIRLLANAAVHLADSTIATLTPQQARLAENLNKNPILVTALNPVIGYAKAAQIAKRAYREKRPVIDVAVEETSLSRRELEKLLNPARLTKGGIVG